MYQIYNFIIIQEILFDVDFNKNTTVFIPQQTGVYPETERGKVSLFYR